jgi:EAL domain-containing protein (putative c-di-GMP-specific phosphodiesterase class I)/AmiR/NasT family two-component response regulator
MGDDGTPGGLVKSQVRILILDDEPFMLHLHAHILAGLGFPSVATCTSGAAASGDVSDLARPNLILLDLNMPEMDGIEFVRKLVERDYTGSLVLISGEDERMLQMAEKLVRAHHISVLGHLRKPVAPEDLARVLETWRPAGGHAARRSYDADDVRAAIANGELFNHYQPKVDVATGAFVGVETLVRWRHPRDGLVMPGQFVDVAEEHGLIDALTRGVLTAAMAQSAAWRQAGLALRVAVNVSMHNLTSPAFADFVSEAAAAAQVAPQDIVLEVTESKLMLDQRGPLEILIRLRLKRFRLSIDDFGTGHSSLTQLHDISFDELKIDQSFVHGACHDPTALAMFDASLRLGKQLGMDVVAEGVEDNDDWALVRRSGCDLAQGYFIARPMPAEELPAWIALWTERYPQLCAVEGAPDPAPFDRRIERRRS